MERKVYLSINNINLLFAKEDDRKLIYDLTIEDKEIVESMFNEANDFHWEEIRDEKSLFFDEQSSRNKYLFIEYEKEIVGVFDIENTSTGKIVFYHIYHDSIVKNIEFHIWMRSMKYTGLGIGTQVLNGMIEYLNKEYSINSFLMRPWIKNERAIYTYQKCGFEIVENFELNTYFTKEEIELHGNGAYTKEETVNMVCTL